MASFFEDVVAMLALSNMIWRKCEVSLTPMPSKGTPRRIKRGSRIPLVLTNHTLNNRIKPILLDNFNIISSESATKKSFFQPPMFAYRRDRNLRNISVHTFNTNQTTPLAGPAPCRHPRFPTCNHIFNHTTQPGPKGSFAIRESFTCMSSGLIYRISCRRCSVFYIGETRHAV